MNTKYPNHICRYNDGEQSCACYEEGYKDPEAQKENKAWETAEEAYNKGLEAGMGIGHYAVTGEYETRGDKLYFYVKTLVRCDNISKEEVQKLTDDLKQKESFLCYNWLSHKLQYVKPLKIK